MLKIFLHFLNPDSERVSLISDQPHISQINFYEECDRVEGSTGLLTIGKSYMQGARHHETIEMFCKKSDS